MNADTPQATDAEIDRLIARAKARIGFGLLVVAWLVWLAAAVYGHILSARFTGPAEDVVDSLNRAAFLAGRLIWFDYVMVVFDLFAVLALFDAWMAHRQRAWRIAGIGLAIGSLFLHGLQTCVGSCLAG